VPRIEGYLTTPDGIRLYFQTLGSGESTLLIPNGLYLVDDFARLAERRTLIVYDMRNRGRSDEIGERDKIARGVLNDVDDLEIVRRHFGLETLDLVGHSYVGLMVMLYAMAHPFRIRRIVQIGPMGPNPKVQYPPPSSVVDDTLRRALASVGELQKQRASYDPETFCRKAWELLGPIYVADPADAHRIDWGRCELANERNALSYWMDTILPSIHRLTIGDGDLAKVQSPVLTIHGAVDRSAPYGGGRDWARSLPNARLITVPHAAHAPWIEAPDLVFRSIETFLDGAWPSEAETIDAL
jgi:pimeloyl-ACP methyl ester carboxylesterase